MDKTEPQLKDVVLSRIDACRFSVDNQIVVWDYLPRTPFGYVSEESKHRDVLQAISIHQPY